MVMRHSWLRDLFPYRRLALNEAKLPLIGGRIS